MNGLKNHGHGYKLTVLKVGYNDYYAESKSVDSSGSHVVEKLEKTPLMTLVHAFLNKNGIDDSEIILALADMEENGNDTAYFNEEGSFSFSKFTGTLH